MITAVQNKSNIFILNRSDLDGRIEPEYYTPSISEIEEKIKIKANKRLSDFIIKMASGATPSVQEQDKYYSNAENGVPFLRVQNLQTNGKLSLNDTNYINYQTHNTSLKRSKVLGGDLLIKITGVGRMAIASVAPDNFEGNTNQHMVVIKTASKKVSEYLASYLNLDIIEKLAKRRATGGTRPALDYKALKSIPIIENIDFSIIEKAEILKQQKEAEAKALLQSIDTYILETLGITIPQKQNGIEHRMFTANFSDVVGSRIDPKLYDRTTKDLKAAIANTSFTKVELKKLLVQSIAGDWGKDENEADLINHEEYTKCLVIRATEFENEGNLTLDNSRVKYRLILNSKLKKIDIQENDLLIEKSGGSIDQPVGRIALITKEHISNNVLCYSNFIHKIRVDKNQVNPFYLFYFLKAIHNLKLTDAMQSQTNGIRNLIMSNYFDQIIPIPSKNIQNEIVKHIDDLHHQINTLKADALAVLDNAKAEVEKIIIG